MRLIVHRGTQQIGGSCVEVATSTTRIIIDAGLPLDDLKEPSRPRQRIRIGQSLPQGLAPQVPGLFGDGPQIDAIFLSHAHGDHSGLLVHTPDAIPIWISQGTSKMLLAGEIFSGQCQIPRERRQILTHREQVIVGDITVTPFPVDHSTFDCLAFLIEADGKRVLYSGDLRLHGRKQGMAAALYNAIRNTSVDVLIMEGTHMGGTRERGPTEHELESDILRHLHSAPGLVLAAFSPLHVDRLVSFYKAARKAGRTLVVDVYGAFVLHLVSGQAKIPRPTAANGIRVYYNRHFKESWQRRRLDTVHRLFLGDQIGLTEIQAEATKHVMLFRPSMTKLDFEGVLPPVHLLYSYWNGYLATPEWQGVREQIAASGGEFHECHTSGHLFHTDIASFIRTIAPRNIIPIHTTYRSGFSTAFENVVILENGQPFEV